MDKRSWNRALILATCAIALSTSALAAVTARLGHAMPDSHPQAVAMKKFAELSGKYTNNNVQLKAFHSAVLGSDEKQLQAVQAGTQEFYIGTLAPFSTRVKEVQVWDLPFMFANTKEVYALLDGASSKKIFQMIEPTGVHGLMWTGMGFRNLSNSKRPVTKLEDIAGLKIRVMANPVALETWKTLGANAVPMAFSEVFTALEIKAIDGQENPLTNIASAKIYEVNPFISLTAHKWECTPVLVSKMAWSRLDAKTKDIIMESMAEATALQLSLSDESGLKLEKDFRANPALTINDVNLDAFRKQTASVFDKWADKPFGGFVKDLRKTVLG